jgi:acetylornithine deacetylase/succinyl-diaminopimelate desuccinylase-like protein
VNDALTGETVELLQQLIRNQCVNDGTVASGQEVRTSHVLRAYFTDAPYFREHGGVAYGLGLFSRALTAEAMAGRFHGNDERIDLESLALTTQAWIDTCELFLG